MRPQLTRRPAALLTVCLLPLLGCSGSGGSGSSSTPGGSVSQGLMVRSISLANNAVLPLNRSIEISFSEEINFSTVNGTSIDIRTAGGAVAAGVFGPLMIDTTGNGQLDSVDRRVVVWQPACPVLADNSDAGLMSGGPGASYTLQIRGTQSNAPGVVTAISGNALRTSEVRFFSIPSSNDPAALFEDTVAGPPRVQVRALGSTLQDGVSYVEVGGNSDPDSRLFFERDDVALPSVVVPGPAVVGGAQVPLNGLADASSRVVFVVEFNQAVNPALRNISDDRLRIEYQLPNTSSWTPIETEVELVSNCTTTGARLRLTPVGLLPPSSSLRVNVLAGFQGLTGLTDSTLTAQSSFAIVQTRPQDHSPLSNADLGADEVYEPFDVGGTLRGSLEDTQSQLITPPAVWGNGELSSTLNFPGAGGENGEFDWIIRQTPELFDTSLQTIQGGPNGELKYEQFTVGGVVDVRDFIILPNAELQVRGPNTFVVNATGEIRIEGVLKVNGGAARDVATLNTGSQPEPGGTGVCGGGDGGTASELRTRSTPRGGTGFGPFGAGKSGGIGGEAGYARDGIPQSRAPDSRRAGGGGGGAFAADQSDVTAQGTGATPSQGMVAGAGFPGNIDAIGGVSRVRPAPGGPPGMGPFVDGDPSNDFLGLRADTQVAILMDGTAPVLQSVGDIIVGELTAVHAGYGGGSGGDSALGPFFPTPNWTVFSDEKGGGGGGGGGSIRLRALGPIRFVGVKSQLQCKGARGATGENSIFVDRIAGSGGSGSGGHVILESATNISFELPPLSDRLPNQRRRIFVDARGFRGTTGGLTNGNGLVLPVDESYGGDGGPGVIQVHVPNAIAPPHEDANLSDLVLPVGTIQELDAGDENALLEVMRPAGIQALPDFGALSGAQSRWVDVRNAGLNPDGSENLLSFLFQGIAPDTGLVRTTNGRVQDLLPILSGPLDPATGSFEGTNRLRLSAQALQPLINSPGPISNDLYLRSPVLLRNFVLRMTPAIGVSLDFVVQDAGYDPQLQELTLSVASSSGVELSAFDVPSSPPSYALMPRFFGVTTGADENSLPAGSSVRISFEGATENSIGAPDESSLLVPETSDVADFQSLAPGQLDFIRFKVEFNLDDQGGGVNTTTPAVKLNFLRLPFVY